MEKPIGELIAPIIARAKTLHGVQVVIDAIPAARDRKAFIMAARENGSIDDEEATQLIQTYQLETA